MLQALADFRAVIICWWLEVFVPSLHTWQALPTLW